ncbi:MAG: hypothetical protein DCF31_15480 [Alphaproteobacteria bacterium]|nr:MAG: hypothetical protein DCF31_15480 [Alphaproteobacteria bacterium]
MIVTRAAIAALGLLLLAAPATARAPLPDGFITGRDANGEPCTASRSWNDPGAPDPFARAFAITCRGVAASRRQGIVYAFPGAAPAADAALCGAPATRQMTGIGAVEARACFDPALGLPVTSVRFRMGGYRYVGAAVATALGPMEVALRVLAGRAAPPTSRDTAIAASIDVAALPAPTGTPDRERATVDKDRLDAAAALQGGIALNYRGLYVEASRLLNDAISRLPPGAAPLTRAELQLEAALADSNISQFDAADEHFAEAAALLKTATDLDRAAFLQSKTATYRGLDLINRRDWPAAITALSDTGLAQQPLTDPAVLSALNQPATGGAAASLSSTDSRQLSRLLVEAQRNWARSVAYLAIGETGRSRAALDETVPYVGQLQRSVSPEAVAALKSRILRQYGRIAARDGRATDAVADFDCALATLQGDREIPGKTCPLQSDAAARIRGEVSFAAGPLIAETQLERASLRARTPGVADADVLKEYDVAVDSLIRSGAAGGIVQPSMEAYLDLLSRLHAKSPTADLEQRFFRAIQAVGEPAIARQVAQLQTIVTANGALGAKARDRAEIERQIIRLRYEIAALDPSDTAGRARLEADRGIAEAALLEANAALAADPRFRAVDDQPTTIEDVRAVLRPGEFYLKVTRLRSRAYAMVIGREKSFIYALDAPAADVDRIARRVRASIRDDSGRLPFFDVGASYALFRLIAGPAESTLATAKAIVVDPSGPLENLPAGVLVTTIDSVKRYLATKAARPNDYSAVAFLGAGTELSNALSPRSFLITRNLPASTAPRPFIGFGENAPARLAQVPATARIAVGTGCDIGYAALAEVMNANKPVSAHELGVAAAALGFPGAPEVTREDFSDVAVLANSARGDYRKFQVVHFATHGVPETRTGECTRIPPSLVTTLAPPIAGGPVSDGLLSLSEVAALDLDANLVALSACETASGVSGVGGRLSGQDESAATLDGLVRAFITANARAVIATYWQVPASVQTEMLIADFYTAGRSQTIGAALRDAQRGVIARPDVSHPYFWGAYFLVGDGSKSMLSGPIATAMSTQ